MKVIRLFLIVLIFFFMNCWGDECGQCPQGHECYYGVCLQAVDWCPPTDPNIEREIIYDDEGNPKKIIYICKEGYYCACKTSDCTQLYCALLPQQ